MKKWKRLTNSVFLLRIATIRDSFFKNILSAKKNGSLRNLNPLSAYCCLSPYRACGVVGQSPTLISPKRFFIAEFIAIQLVFVATMNFPFLSISLFIAPSYPSKLAFPALSPSSQRLLLSRKSFL